MPLVADERIIAGNLEAAGMSEDDLLRKLKEEGIPAPGDEDLPRVVH